MKIEVCERLNDYRLVPQRDEQGHIVVKHGVVALVHGPKYHAQIEGNPGLWACGDTHDEAVGNLIRTHPEKFGITLAFLGKLAR